MGKGSKPGQHTKKKNSTEGKLAVEASSSPSQIAPAPPPLPNATTGGSPPLTIEREEQQSNSNAQVPTYFYKASTTTATATLPAGVNPGGMSNGLVWCAQPSTTVSSSGRDGQQGSSGSDAVAAVVAKLFLPLDAVDQETLKQVALMSQLPSIEHPRFMPDTHKGASCCVGFTAQMRPYMSPQLIGGDIGCGVSAVPIPANIVEKRKDKFLGKLNKAMHQLVPMGNGHSHIHPGASLEDLPFSLDQLVPFLSEATSELRLFAEQFAAKFPEHNIYAQLDRIFAASIPSPRRTPHDDGGQENNNMKEKRRNSGSGSSSAFRYCYSLDFFKSRLAHLQCPLIKVLKNLGTLGGGNHFMELDELQPSEGEGENRGVEESPHVESQHQKTSGEGKVQLVVEEKEAKYLLVVHSGSRCFGQAVYTYWADVQHHGGGSKPLKTAVAASSGAANHHQTPRVEDEQLDDDNERFGFDPDLMLGFEDSVGYFVDMILAQQFAQANRMAMLSVVCSALDPLLRGDDEGMGGAQDEDRELGLVDYVEEEEELLLEEEGENRSVPSPTAGDPKVNPQQQQQQQQQPPRDSPTRRIFSGDAASTVSRRCCTEQYAQLH